MSGNENRSCVLTRMGTSRCSCWTLEDSASRSVRGSYSTLQDAKIAASEMGYPEANVEVFDPIESWTEQDRREGRTE